MHFIFASRSQYSLVVIDRERFDFAVKISELVEQTEMGVIPYLDAVV